MQSSDAQLNEILSAINELVKWTRFAGMQQLKNILTQNLKNDIEMAVYELSDGNRGTREIAKFVGMGSNATIARYWKNWNKIGIVEKSKKVQGRYRHICSLEEVGLTIPQLVSKATIEEATIEEPEDASTSSSAKPMDGGDKTGQ